MQQELKREETAQMDKAVVSEPAATERASLIESVSKSDAGFCFCVDYRRLNAVTIRDSYMIPLLDEYIDSLEEARLFTILDANS